MEDGKLVVLVVDDDPDVRDVAVFALELNGYVVAQAADGGAALEILVARPTIDALFTDIVMPGMSGFELAHKAKQVRPDLRIAYTSGFTRDLPWGQHGVGYGPLIEKPWDAQQLAQRLAGVFQGC